ncbi:MAG: outer membrane protein assembly factor BamD [Betaproteobacteria bacterium]|jgi:outer membrane protein assembly factor BamD
MRDALNAGRASGRRWLSAVALCAVALLAACGSLDKDPTAKWDADRIYREAQTEMSANNWQAARRLLERLESRFPFTRYAQQAQIEIAYTYYKEGESAQAISAADRFLKLNPNHPNADYAQYLKGLATFADDLGLLGRFLDPTTRDPKAMREAFDTFKELVNRWPNSKYAEDATQRMNWLVNALAQSEVNVARYYLRRGAYIAAVQRAQGALREFQGTPAAEEALAVLVKAYEALQMTELRADAERVLNANFPGSRAVERVSRRN